MFEPKATASHLDSTIFDGFTPGRRLGNVRFVPKAPKPSRSQERIFEFIPFPERDATSSRDAAHTRRGRSDLIFASSQRRETGHAEVCVGCSDGSGFGRLPA